MIRNPKEARVAEVVLKDVDKIYEGNVHAVQSLSLEIPDGEFLVLVGPPGAARRRLCGWWPGWRRSRAARSRSAIASSTTCRRRTATSRWCSRATRSTRTSPSSDNIAFGLRLRKLPKEVVDQRIAWAAKLLDLTPYLARKPKELSGGQRQRVAMGRAIVREPQVFLMDEPLSNLDAKLRVQMRAEVAKLQHDLGVTTIYVTHDQIEAMTMGDRVAVMSMGKLQQVDTPQHLYDEPFNMFVASFIGTPPMNLVEAVVSVAGEAVTVSVGPTTTHRRPVLDRPLSPGSRPVTATRSCWGSGRRTCTRPATARDSRPSTRGSTSSRRWGPA